MNSKHRRTLQSIFAPKSGVVEWRAIESLFSAAGAKTVEGRGSRVRFVYGNITATFHRPHPEKDAKPYQIRDAKAFLESIGVKP